MKRTILIVEDEKALQNAAKMGLQKHEYETISVASKKEAMAIISSDHRVDAVWLDHYLIGKESGLDLLTEIRSSAEYRAIPVFVVTNSVDDDKISSYAALGVEKYFVKADSKISDIIGDIGKFFAKKGENNHVY